MSEENKAIARRYIEDLWQKGNLNITDELLATDFVNHVAPPGSPSGRDGMKGLVTYVRSVFPDLAFTIEDVIAEGDKVVCRWTSYGTHRGKLWGISPTGKHIKIAGVTILRISGRRVVEHWVNSDDLGMVQQLGAVLSVGRAS